MDATTLNINFRLLKGTFKLNCENKEIGVCKLSKLFWKSYTDLLTKP